MGTVLVSALERRGHRVLASTRRRGTLSEKRLYLDLEDCKSFCLPNGIGYVFVVAAVTNYERCETDPLAHKINVELIPRLVLSLLEQDVFVTFISTNTVFGGEHAWPSEYDPQAPKIPYARQKAQAENIIREGAYNSKTEDLLSIVRLTKILALSTPPLPAWFSAWSRGEQIQPFADLIFAPMSSKFVGESLASIGESGVNGNLHLSGAENISYVDLANNLASYIPIGPGLIKAANAGAFGVQPAFKPRYSGLGMLRTTQQTGLKPQSIEDVVRDLMS